MHAGPPSSCPISPPLARPISPLLFQIYIIPAVSGRCGKMCGKNAGKHVGKHTGKMRGKMREKIACMREKCGKKTHAFYMHFYDVKAVQFFPAISPHACNLFAHFFPHFSRMFPRMFSRIFPRMFSWNDVAHIFKVLSFHGAHGTLGHPGPRGPMGPM